MPLLFTCIRNATFEARDEGAEYDDPQAALAAGVRSAAMLAADEINKGERSAAVEIGVERPDGTQLLSSVVVMSVSPLMAYSRGR